MCRLYGFLANEPTKVDCSLVYAQNALMQQSRVDGTGVNHTDGWGISIYRDDIPVLERKTTAACSDQRFTRAAESSYSTAIVAHIRKSTVGEVSESNTHPFVWDHWTFAHNGNITAFDSVAPGLIVETAPDLQEFRHGETDSEQYFLWLLSRIREIKPDAQIDETNTAQSVLDHLLVSIADLDQRCRDIAPDEIPKLNFVMTDGQIMIACRWNLTLYFVERAGVRACEICGIPHIHHNETANHRAVSMASEPVTDEHWRPVPNFSLIIRSPILNWSLWSGIHLAAL